MIAKRFGLSETEWADDIAVKRAVLLVHPNSQLEQLRFVVRHALPQFPLFTVDPTKWPNCRRRWAKIREILDHRTELTQDAMKLRCQRGGSFARQLGYNERICTAIEQLFASFDGKGVPAGLAGTDITIEAQLIRLGHEVSIHYDQGGKRAARRAVKRRRGNVLNPDVVDAFTVVQQEPGFWDLLGNQRLFRDWLIDLERAAGSVQMMSGFDGLFQVIGLIARAINLKTPYTHDHSDRVGAYAYDLALAYRPGDIGFANVVKAAAILHDTGKIKVREKTLMKPGPLDDDEWTEMKQHPLWGAEIVSEIPGFVVVRDVMLTHHAGTSLVGPGAYPTLTLTDQAASQSLEARIVAVADTYDAMYADRPYRSKRMTLEEVLSELDKHAVRGHLDPDIVALVAPLVPAWSELMVQSRQPLAA